MSRKFSLQHPVNDPRLKDSTSGPFWYASGATVQILLFATLAIELKRKAPNAHTFLEVIRARYGVYTHLVFTVSSCSFVKAPDAC